MNPGTSYGYLFIDPYWFEGYKNFLYQVTTFNPYVCAKRDVDGDSDSSLDPLMTMISYTSHNARCDEISQGSSSHLVEHIVDHEDSLLHPHCMFL